MRLDKYLTQAQLGSRREVKEYIKKKRIVVNDSLDIKPEMQIDPVNDVIMLDGKQISATLEKRYYVLHKPAGYITATKDDNKSTVMDLFDKSISKGLFAVGRLDKDTEGLLLITDDGEFDHRLMSPKKHVSKKYFAVLSAECPSDLIDEFDRGVDIGDDRPCKSAELIITDKKDEVYITISEGRYHQIKRMFLKYGLKVEYLKRVMIGNFELPLELEPGEYRALTEEERLLCLGE